MNRRLCSASTIRLASGYRKVPTGHRPYFIPAFVGAKPDVGVVIRHPVRPRNVRQRSLWHAAVLPPQPSVRATGDRLTNPARDWWCSAAILPACRGWPRRRWPDRFWRPPRMRPYGKGRNPGPRARRSSGTITSDRPARSRAASRVGAGHGLLAFVAFGEPVAQPPAPLIMKQPGSARLLCEDLPRTPRPDPGRGRSAVPC